MTETGIIRKKRSKFAQISNHCLRSNKLSLRAKGLYGLIQSFIDIPDFVLYKSILQDKYCTEGRDVFNRTWKELVEAGYLKTYKINTKAGFVYEYELLDEPEENGKENPSNDNEEGKTSALKTKIVRLSPDTEKPYVGPGTENPHVGNPDVGNPSPNNTYTKYTNTNNTYSSNNNVLDNTSNVVENPSSHYSVVVETKEDKDFIDFAKKECRILERKIVSENKVYDCFLDPVFEGYEFNDVPWMEEFNDYHRNNKVSSLVRYKDFAPVWIGNAEARKASDHIRKVESLYFRVANSIVQPELRYAIANFTIDEHLTAMKKVSEYFDPDSLSNIHNPQGYAAKTLYALANAKLIDMMNAFC